jgi:NAD(P)-dependent dehydrogenase (short-subunit alcohol dehydrogenase family)
MPTYELLRYHFRSPETAAHFLQTSASHDRRQDRGTETLGISASPSDPTVVVEIVCHTDESGARPALDAPGIQRVETLALEPRAAGVPEASRGPSGQGRLAGKVALITGGARGQGEAEARLFAQHGAHVYICDVLEEEGEKLAAELRGSGLQADFRFLDVTDAEQWSRTVAHIDAGAGRLDVLINNAGINVRHQLTDTTSDEWDRIVAVNTKGQMLGMQACAPLMKRSGNGSIINLGSTAGIMGHPVAAYSASKWAVRGLTKAAAMELASSGIRVNAMHPGVVETPMVDAGSRVFAELRSLTPLGRAAQPSEMASAALFLASDESSFITGIDLAVDGGFSELAAYGEVWKRLNTAL